MKSEKITYGESRRTYGDACGAAHALDLLGERWALLVVRELMLGAKRFGDLRADLPGISANVLTQRLEHLEDVGIVRRRRLPAPAGIQVYELTEWGSESEPIFQALGRWAARSPGHDPSLPLSATSLLMSLKTMFDPGQAWGFSARVGLRLGRESFVVTVAKGQIETDRAPADGADAVLAGAPATLAGAIYGGAKLDDLARAGALAVEGDRRVAERFVSLFRLPPKAAEADLPEVAGR